jgi:acetyl-CoA carboxylase beta subunit
MNWITKFIKPRLKTLLKKRQPKPSETGLWTTCVCQQLIYKEDLHNNFFVCPKCETHQKSRVEIDSKFSWIMVNMRL